MTSCPFGCRWQLIDVLTSRRLSAVLIVLGFAIFLVPFLQFPGAVLLFVGSFINAASDRPFWPKLLWLLPLLSVPLFVAAFFLYF